MEATPVALAHYSRVYWSEVSGIWKDVPSPGIPILNLSQLIPRVPSLSLESVPSTNQTNEPSEASEEALMYEQQLQKLRDHHHALASLYSNKIAALQQRVQDLETQLAQANSVSEQKNRMPFWKWFRGNAPLLSTAKKVLLQDVVFSVGVLVLLMVLVLGLIQVDIQSSTVKNKYLKQPDKPLESAPTFPSPKLDSINTPPRQPYPHFNQGVLIHPYCAPGN